MVNRSVPSRFERLSELTWENLLKTTGTFFKKAVLALSLAVYMTPSALAWGGDSKKNEQAVSQDPSATVSAEKQLNGHNWMKARVLIKASPHVVWETVHEERKHDPDLAYSKILSQEKNQATLEQKFALIPVIGTAVCVMHNAEVPFERIDYNMISSDRFKAMEGSWVLTPGREANSTYLELSSYCDLGLPIPRSMIDGVTTKKLQKRLANVKTMAEATQGRLAAHSKPE